MNFVIYLTTAVIPIPSLLGLGEVRVLIVAILSRIGEEALIRYIQQTLSEPKLNTKHQIYRDYESTKKSDAV